MSTISLIPSDGYTEHGYLTGIPHLYAELRFDYRPATLRQQSLFFEAASKLAGMKFRNAQAAFVKTQLVSWSMKDKDGVAVPITEANLIQLKPKLFNRFFDVVIGNEPSDDDPKGDAGPHEEGTGED